MRFNKQINSSIQCMFVVLGVGKVLGNRYKLGEKVAVTNGDKASGNFIKYDVEVRDADVVSLILFK